MNDRPKRVRVTDLRQWKARGEKIAMLTAYDFAMASVLDRAGMDILLVGDSLGMVFLGQDTTLQVTMDAMRHHTAAVARGARRALVVTDLPFLSYQASVEDAIRNAGTLLQAGAAAVKLEGGRPMADTVQRLVDVGIPVMGHLGLTPQSINQLGGYRQQAKRKPEADQLVEDALALEAAGAFSIVLECIPAEVAADVTERLSIPTIGIGSGPHCDGQVLVCYDAFGLTQGSLPSFAKQYAQLGELMEAAARSYAEEVRSGRFAEQSSVLKAGASRE